MLKRTPLKKTAFVNKGKKSLNASSSKQKLVNQSYHEKKEGFYDNGEEIICTGCQSSTNTTPSHLLPRSKRSDLIDCMEIVVPHCIKCHNTFESIDAPKLLDFEANFKIIFEKDPSYFELRIQKILSHQKDRDLVVRTEKLYCELTFDE
jgi:hypothetical protein